MSVSDEEARAAVLREASMLPPCAQAHFGSKAGCSADGWHQPTPWRLQRRVEGSHNGRQAAADWRTAAGHLTPGLATLPPSAMPPKRKCNWAGASSGAIWWIPC